jgi:hypothetical protein
MSCTKKNFLLDSTQTWPKILDQNRSDKHASLQHCSTTLPLEVFETSFIFGFKPVSLPKWIPMWWGLNRIRLDTQMYQ